MSELEIKHGGVWKRPQIITHKNRSTHEQELVKEVYAKKDGIWGKTWGLTPIPSNMVIFYRQNGVGTFMNMGNKYIVPLGSGETSARTIDSSNPSINDSGDYNGVLYSGNNNHLSANSGGFYLPSTNSSHAHTAAANYHKHSASPETNNFYIYYHKIQAWKDVPYLNPKALIFTLNGNIDTILAEFWELYTSSNWRYLLLDDSNENSPSNGGYNSVSFGNHSNSSGAALNTGAGGGGSTWYRVHYHTFTHSHPTLSPRPYYRMVAMLEAKQRIDYIEQLPKGALMCFLDDNLPEGFVRWTDSENRSLRLNSSSPNSSGGGNSYNLPNSGFFSSGAAGSFSDSKKYRSGSGRYVVSSSHSHSGPSHSHTFGVSFAYMKRFGFIMAKKDY